LYRKKKKQNDFDYRGKKKSFLAARPTFGFQIERKPRGEPYSRRVLLGGGRKERIETPYGEKKSDRKVSNQPFLKDVEEGVQGRGKSRRRRR